MIRFLADNGMGIFWMVAAVTLATTFSLVARDMRRTIFNLQARLDRAKLDHNALTEQYQRFTDDLRLVNYDLERINSKL